MSTLAQMRSRIADAINRTDLNTQIDLAINRAITHYTKKDNFWFMETSGTFSTISGQSSYGTADGIPSDIEDIDYIEVTYGSYKYKLDRVDFDIITEVLGVNTGTENYPTVYAFYQKKIYLYPKPNGVRTITIYYKKSYSALSLDADTNDFTTYAEDLIEARANWSVNSSILKDQASAQSAESRELKAYKALVVETNKLSAKGHVTPTQF